MIFSPCSSKTTSRRLKCVRFNDIFWVQVMRQKTIMFLLLCAYKTKIVLKTGMLFVINNTLFIHQNKNCIFNFIKLSSCELSPKIAHHSWIVGRNKIGHWKFAKQRNYIVSLFICLSIDSYRTAWNFSSVFEFRINLRWIKMSIPYSITQCVYVYTLFIYI